MSKKYINPHIKKGAFAQKLVSVPDLASLISKGDRGALSQGITLVESDLISDRAITRELLQALSPDIEKNQSLRIAISGSPGVGKSSFIEALSKEQPNESMAILAVDPSSSQSHGSILGDKTRMEELVTRKNAFIRPSPAGKTLGGVTAKTRETILLCEAAGFRKIIVETVGVGQSETAVSNMVDLFILLILPGSGDEVQGIKRGIVELADMILVTKVDGERETLARSSQSAYRNAIHLFRQKHKDWTIPVFGCSSVTGHGIDTVWEKINEFGAFAQKDAWLTTHRKSQNMKWYQELLREKAMELFFNASDAKELINKHQLLIEAGETDIWKLLDQF